MPNHESGSSGPGPEGLGGPPPDFAGETPPDPLHPAGPEPAHGPEAAEDSAADVFAPVDADVDAPDVIDSPESESEPGRLRRIWQNIDQWTDTERHTAKESARWLGGVVAKGSKWGRQRMGMDTSPVIMETSLEHPQLQNPLSEDDYRYEMHGIKAEHEHVSSEIAELMQRIESETDETERQRLEATLHEKQDRQSELNADKFNTWYLHKRGQTEKDRIANADHEQERADRSQAWQDRRNKHQEAKRVKREDEVRSRLKAEEEENSTQADATSQQPGSGNSNTTESGDVIKQVFAPHVQAALKRFPNVKPENVSLADLDRIINAQTDPDTMRDLRIVRSQRFKDQSNRLVAAQKAQIDRAANGSIRYTDELMNRVNLGRDPRLPYDPKLTAQVGNEIMDTRRLLAKLKEKQGLASVDNGDPAAIGAEIEKASARLQSLEEVYAVRQEMDRAQQKSRDVSSWLALRSDEYGSYPEGIPYKVAKGRADRANSKGYPSLDAENSTEKQYVRRTEQIGKWLAAEQAKLVAERSKLAAEEAKAYQDQSQEQIQHSLEQIRESRIKIILLEKQRTLLNAELQRRAEQRDLIDQYYSGRTRILRRPTPGSATRGQMKDRRSRENTDQYHARLKAKEERAAAKQKRKAAEKNRRSSTVS